MHSKVVYASKFNKVLPARQRPLPRALQMR